MLAWRWDVGRLIACAHAGSPFLLVICSYKGCILSTDRNTFYHQPASSDSSLPTIRPSLRIARNPRKNASKSIHCSRRHNPTYNRNVHKDASHRRYLCPRGCHPDPCRSTRPDWRHITLPYGLRNTTRGLRSSAWRTIPNFRSSPSPRWRQVRMPNRWPTCMQRAQSVGSVQLGEGAVPACRCWHAMFGRRDCLCTRLWHERVRRRNLCRPSAVL